MNGADDFQECDIRRCTNQAGTVMLVGFGGVVKNEMKDFACYFLNMTEANGASIRGGQYLNDDAVVTGTTSLLLHVVASTNFRIPSYCCSQHIICSY